MKAETLVTAFKEKGMNLDGMPFHKPHNGITRPEIGASLAFAERMASLAFQVRYLNDLHYVSELKRLLLSKVYKMFSLRSDTAKKYVDLAIQEVCLNDMCKKCDGRGAVPSKYKIRKIAKVKEVDEKWRLIEIEYKKYAHDYKVDGDLVSYRKKVNYLANKYSVTSGEILRKAQGWTEDKLSKEKKPKAIAMNYDHECSACNGTGFGRMLDKERAEFLKVAASTYSNDHKGKYDRVYLHLWGTLQSINTH
ncbi:hypothetical protein PsalMR5_04905 (plasmid) [Piscirickettsia salmonis]|uniref:hypothetical protein n=1 Tax=Piscirickettsia salmonis TaxID=1238 RepID=UPI0012BAC1B2|nr:hypothetical protein [Piscirickettsia salmonis]QGP57385.1 hypothetical protein PsalSR1_04874 [Piscirickettsia salmonis]QGP66980.1 hypothetical protein PsalMR5_04905 [Piscirickettsia salmonis]